MAKQLEARVAELEKLVASLKMNESIVKNEEKKVSDIGKKKKGKNRISDILK